MTDDPRTTEGLADSSNVRAVVRECRLTFIGGDRDGAVHPFAAERMVIGADARADCVIADTAMSKFHCEIRIVEGKPFIKDLGSRNGTVVDHVPVIEAPLRDGAMLALGRTQLQFHLGARHVEIALSPRDHFGRLRGRSIPMRATFALLELAAGTNTTVLLQGESGTGKDLAAESLHTEGARRDGPFVVVDCGAIPANLLEAELFGYEAGAFTNAVSRRTGAFEAASGGTLLLDEIGELALDLQPKLLRALDRHEIQRIGSSERIAVDVRIIAATNRKLREEVNARRFRSDLYYRLAVLEITMPPLRERTGDIAMLVDSILEDLGPRSDMGPEMERAGERRGAGPEMERAGERRGAGPEMERAGERRGAGPDTPAAVALRSGDLLPDLLRHSWPGNVRELRNYLEACIVRQEVGLVPTTSAEPMIDVELPLRVIRERWIRHVERNYLERLLAVHGNNVSAAARAAGVDRVHLHRLLSRAGLR